MKTKLFILSFITGLLGFCQLPSGFDKELFATHVEPIDIELHPNNDKLVIAERRGLLFVYDLIGEDWVKDQDTLLDIRDLVTVGQNGERGLQSIAITPHHITVGYTREESTLWDEPKNEDSATYNYVSRWEVTWTLNHIFFDEQVLERIPSLSNYHNVTELWLCGTQLCIGTGDSKQADYAQQAVDRGIIPLEHRDYTGKYRAQIKSSPNGKILRVRPHTGTAALGNPYYDSSNQDSWLSKMYAYGFRNPFKIRDGLVGDVGVNTNEEIGELVLNGNGGHGALEGFDSSSWDGSIIDPDTGQPFALENIEKPLLDHGHFSNPRTRLLGEDNEPFFDGNPIQGHAIVLLGKLKEGFGNHTNKVAFADYAIGNINLATYNAEGTLFISTENFAPNGTFSLITDLTQLPDGSMLVAKKGGDIERVFFKETLSVPKHDYGRLIETSHVDMLGKKVQLEYASIGVYIEISRYQYGEIREKIIKQ